MKIKHSEVQHNIKKQFKTIQENSRKANQQKIYQNGEFE